MSKSKLQDEIARVAYGLYEKRGRAHGCAAEDWIAAEKIVMAREAKAKDVKAAVPATKKKLTAPKEQAAKPAAKTVSPRTKKTSAKKKEL